MTNEEAIECLKRRLKCSEYVDSDYCDSIDLEAIKIAIEALEKQIPEKVHRSDGTHYCECGEIVKCYELYCDQCGQRLDWSE